MITLEIKVDTTGETGRALASLTDSLKRFTPEMQKAETLLRDGVNKNFMEGGRPTWKPLSPVTIRARKARARKRGTPPVAGYETVLRETDTLRKSLAVRGSEGGYRKLTPLSVAIGTTLDYARGHQFGAGVPARPFLVLDAAEKQAIAKAVQTGVAFRVKRAVAEAKNARP